MRLKFSPKGTHPPRLGRPQTHGGGLTGRLSKARDQRDSNLAPFSALTITNFSREKCFFSLFFTILNEKDLGNGTRKGYFAGT